MRNLFLVVFICFAMNVSAQDKKQNRTPEEMAKARTERMAKKLGLSEDQKTKVYDLNLKEAQEQKDKRDGSKEAVAKKDAALRALLTPEQVKTFDEMTANREKKGDRGERKNETGRNKKKAK